MTQQIEIPPPSLDDVLYRADGEIAWVTLNRPVVLNAVNWSIRRRLMWALRQAEADDAVKVVILTGAGRAFCAGGDIQSTPPDDNLPTPDGMAIFMTIWSMPKPVIAAVRGHAVGQGCELAGICDLTIATEDAKLGEIQIRHGLRYRKHLHHFAAARERCGPTPGRRHVIATRRRWSIARYNENRPRRWNGRAAWLTAAEGRAHGYCIGPGSKNTTAIKARRRGFFPASIYMEPVCQSRPLFAGAPGRRLSRRAPYCN